MTIVPPCDIHITINPKSLPVDMDDLAFYRIITTTPALNELKAKPLWIEMRDADGSVYDKQPMLSIPGHLLVKDVTNFNDAYQQWHTLAERAESVLKQLGMEPCRRKIEIAPFDLSLITHETMPLLYVEAHVAYWIPYNTDGHIVNMLNAAIESSKAVVSINTLKAAILTGSTNIITWRIPLAGRSENDIKCAVEQLMGLIESFDTVIQQASHVACDIMWLKTVMEWAIYDDNEGLDAGWLNHTQHLIIAP